MTAYKEPHADISPTEWKEGRVLLDATKIGIILPQYVRIRYVENHPVEGVFCSEDGTGGRIRYNRMMK